MAGWRTFWVPEDRRVAGDRGSVLAGWEDLAVREDRVGIHPGDPIPLSPDFRIDEVLSWYLCRSSFARLAPETKRNYTDDYCLFFDYLWGRGRWWSEASADDLWDFEDWRTRSPRNPWKIGGARWNRGLAALARLYEWAVQREHVPVNPGADEVGCRPERRAGPGAGGSGEERSDQRGALADAAGVSPLVDVGSRGCDANGLATAGWTGRLADRNATFADLLTWESSANALNSSALPARSSRNIIVHCSPVSLTLWRNYGGCAAGLDSSFPAASRSAHATRPPRGGEAHARPAVCAATISARRWCGRSC